jgi:hypothetical protein
MSAPREQGQVTLEYFILFTAIALVTLVGVATFDDTLNDLARDFFNAAAAKIAN